MSRFCLLAVSFLACSVCVTGCGPDCPDVNRIDWSVTPPGLVQMLFSVECDDEPVTSIVSSDLVLTEGGEEVSRTEAAWIVEGVSAALETYTLLLMDVSDSIINEGTLEVAQEVAASFAEGLVDQGQRVSVAVFDGDPAIRTVLDFSTDPGALRSAIEGIGADDQLDPSTNLNGAVLQGLDILDGVVVPSVEAQLVSVASLVVFTDGTDRAGRETHQAAVSAVNSSPHDVFLVGLVGEQPEAIEELTDLAPSGFFRAGDADALTQSFAELSASLIAEVNKYYRLSYCSPLRAPRTTLKLEVVMEDGKDTISVTYPTKDFGPDCELPGAR